MQMSGPPRGSLWAQDASRELRTRGLENSGLRRGKTNHSCRKILQMLSFSIALLGTTSLDGLSHILLWVRWHVRPVFGTGPTNNNCLILLTIDSCQIL